MTRGEFYDNSDSLLRTAIGSGFEDDPVFASLQLDMAADRVCRDTDCFYDVQPTSITADQSLYCAPTIYRVKDQYVVDASGRECELIVRTPAEMTRYFGANWRSHQSDDPPSIWVPEGTTRGQLWPKPSVTRGAALVFEGYATTTSKVTGSTAHLWPGDTDECPLPDDAQAALLHLFAANRCLPLLRNMPDLIGFKRELEREYERESGMLEANVARRYRRRRLGSGAARANITYR